MNSRNSGFSNGIVFTLIIVAILIAGLSIFFYKRINPVKISETETNINSEANQNLTEVIWHHDGTEWKAKSTPPSCPEPFDFELPSVLDSATATIWPGQERGGDFKAHGGLRYDNNPSGDVEVYAPFDGLLYKVGRYDVEGVPQIIIDAINNCGMMFRIDHILELADDLKKIMDDFPGDGTSSQLYEISPVVIKKGQLLANKIGIPSQPNIFYDLGVYDLRQKNESAQDEEWAISHNPEFAHYGICWFDLLPNEISKIIRDLPTGNEGKISDYCAN